MITIPNSFCTFFSRDVSTFDVSEDVKPSSAGQQLYRLLQMILDQRCFIYGTLVGILLGCQLTAVKLVTSITPFQILLYRSIVYLPSIFFVDFGDVHSYSVSDWMIYLLCGALNALAVVLAYVAVGFAHVGNVSCIIANQPIPGAILNRAFFGEPIEFMKYLLILFNFIGVVLVSKPPLIFDCGEVMDYKREFIGALFGIASLICYVLAVLFTKIITNRGKVDTALLIEMLGVSGTIAALLHMSITNNFELLPPLNECIFVAGIAFASLGGSVFMIWALHKVPFIGMSILFTLCIPVAFVLGRIVLDEVSDLLSIVGTILVVGSTIGFLLPSTS